MDHVSISRHHAVMQFTDDQLLPSLVDLGSSHGSFVNKRQIPSHQPLNLRIGDQIRFGASSRIWILGSPDPLDTPNADSDTREHKAARSMEYGDPVKYLKSVLRDLGHEYCPEQSASDQEEDTDHSSGRQVTVRIGLPLADESGNTIYGIAQASRLADAERLACIDALEGLDQHGYLDAQNKHQPHNDDDNDDNGDDDFYDQTKPTPQSDVETFDTLTDKLHKTNEVIVRMQGELDSLLRPNGGSEEVPGDELDAFMSALAQKERLDAQKKLTKKLEALTAQRSRLDALLKIVAPDHIDPLPIPPRPAPKSTATVTPIPAAQKGAKRQVALSPPCEDPSQTALPVAKHAKTSIDTDIAWQPPANQSGDGRTSLNDKYGY
ncbi:hypothetical protein IWW37_000172 [Coemansia sp. RSA 2050]|nr:hypothetical protein IWW37_000172 [Coemansia sp. RSA 2050]KAJ2737128.1 hypothetical protein IW152_000149 [Coemansia sp. BCRC 34962]